MMKLFIALLFGFLSTMLAEAQTQPTNINPDVPSVSPPLTAVGTTQGGALVLTNSVNQVTGAAGACPVGGPYTSCNGVGLNANWSQGRSQTVCSPITIANGFLVYPDGSGAIQGGAAGAPVRVEVGSCNTFNKLTIGANGQWTVS